MRRFVRRHDRNQSGVALVEFAVLMPLALLLLTGMVEFGFAFNHNLTLEYATREGARTGAALGDGTGSTVSCIDIDAEVIAAVERVLAAPGSAISLDRVSDISIWQSTSTGAPVAGAVNLWTYTGPATGPSVNGERLAFSRSGGDNWSACTRSSGPPADSVGVSLSYTYQMVGPVGAITRFFGGASAASMPMTDQTVMAISPVQ